MKSITIIGFDPERTTKKSMDDYKKCILNSDYMCSYYKIPDGSDLSGLTIKKVTPTFSALVYEKDGTFSTVFVPSYYSWSDFDTEAYYIREIKNAYGKDNNVCNFTTDFDLISDITLACLADPTVTEGYPTFSVEGLKFSQNGELYPWGGVNITSNRLMVHDVGVCDSIKLEYGFNQYTELVLRYNSIEPQDVVIGKIFYAIFKRFPGTADDAIIIRNILHSISVYDSVIARSIITYCNHVATHDMLPDKLKDLVSI